MATHLHGATAARRRRPCRRLSVAVVSGIAVVTAVVLVGAALTPGNESYTAKLADWLRSHHASAVTNAAERWQYRLDPPTRGGRPRGLNPLPPADGARPRPPAVAPSPSVPGPPPPVALVVHPALPGEGVWQPVGPVVGGGPAMYEAQFRADAVYSGQITTAVLLEPGRLSFELVPGLTQPGGTWPHPPHVTAAELPTVVAAFNGGFRLQDSHGGMLVDGRTAAPLRAGAASLVLYSDGSVQVGAWGSEVGPGPTVRSVVQNLVPLVDQGQPSATATAGDSHVWGDTLSTDAVVARSGLGITSAGALVYVAGPELSVRTLAEALVRAGAIRAMELDINPEWVTFNFFTHPDAGDPSQVIGTAIYPQQQRPPDRYLPPAAESRAFIEVSTCPSNGCGAAG